MEESEKRRERLRAMRMEADQAGGVSNYVEISLPNHLSNPLAESSAAMVGQSEPCSTPRFDYYTNPMSAFSANKKKVKIDNQPMPDIYVPSHPDNSSAAYFPSHPNNSPAAYVPSHPNNPPAAYVPSHPNNSPAAYVPSHPNNSPAAYVPSHPNNSPAAYVPSHPNNSPAAYVPSHHNNSPATYVPTNLPGLRNSEMSPSPTHQFHQRSPDQRMFYARGFSGSDGHGSPALPRPFPMDQGPPDMWHGPGRPFVNHFPGHPPRGMSSPRSPFVNQFPSYPPREMSSPSLVSGPRGNSYTNPTQDRVSYRSPSSSPGYQGNSSPGRGNHGHRGNMTPRPRFGSGRGAGSHGSRFSSEESPRVGQFYNESMLEDPWKVLQPGIWKPIAPWRSSSNPLEPKISNFGTKKARVSDSTGGSSSQPSLAEYLAASFNAAVNDAPSV